MRDKKAAVNGLRWLVDRGSTAAPWRLRGLDARWREYTPEFDHFAGPPLCSMAIDSCRAWLRPFGLCPLQGTPRVHPKGCPKGCPPLAHCTASGAPPLAPCPLGTPEGV